MSSLVNALAVIGEAAGYVLLFAVLAAVLVLDIYIVLAGVTAVLAAPLFAAPISGTAIALVIIYFLIRALVIAVRS